MILSNSLLRITHFLAIHAGELRGSWQFTQVNCGGPGNSRR
jgi:hypothetical protein